MCHAKQLKPDSRPLPPLRRPARHRCDAGAHAALGGGPPNSGGAAAHHGEGWLRWQWQWRLRWQPLHWRGASWGTAHICPSAAAASAAAGAAALCAAPRSQCRCCSPPCRFTLVPKQDEVVAPCWDMPEHTFGGAYARFMGTRGFLASGRPPCRCAPRRRRARMRRWSGPACRALPCRLGDRSCEQAHVHIAHMSCTIACPAPANPIPRPLTPLAPAPPPLRPSASPPCRFVDDPELAYVISRARQVHDFWHVLFGCHTNGFGEVALKAMEFVQVG